MTRAMTEVCIIMGRKHDGEAAQLYSWLHNLILSLSLERWANICKAGVLVWHSGQRQGYVERQKTVYQPFFSGYHEQFGVQWSDEIFPFPYCSLSFWLSQDLLQSEVRLTEGTFGSAIQVDKRLNVFNITSCAGDTEKKSLIVDNIFNLEISAPEEPPTSCPQGQKHIYTSRSLLAQRKELNSDSLS